MAQTLAESFLADLDELSDDDDLMQDEEAQEDDQQQDKGDDEVTPAQPAELSAPLSKQHRLRERTQCRRAARVHKAEARFGPGALATSAHSAQLPLACA